MPAAVVGTCLLDCDIHLHCKDVDMQSHSFIVNSFDCDTRIAQSKSDWKMHCIVLFCDEHIKR